MADKFGPTRDGWQLIREGEILHEGQKTFVPDFTFRHEDGTQVFLEIVGFWTPEYLARQAGDAPPVPPAQNPAGRARKLPPRRRHHRRQHRHLQDGHQTPAPAGRLRRRASPTTALTMSKR